MTFPLRAAGVSGWTFNQDQTEESSLVQLDCVQRRACVYSQEVLVLSDAQNDFFFFFNCICLS